MIFLFSKGSFETIKKKIVSTPLTVVTVVRQPRGECVFTRRVFIADRLIPGGDVRLPKNLRAPGVCGGTSPGNVLLLKLISATYRAEPSVVIYRRAPRTNIFDNADEPYAPSPGAGKPSSPPRAASGPTPPPVLPRRVLIDFIGRARPRPTRDEHVKTSRTMRSRACTRRCPIMWSGRRASVRRRRFGQKIQQPPREKR